MEALSALEHIPRLFQPGLRAHVTAPTRLREIQGGLRWLTVHVSLTICILTGLLLLENYASSC